METLAFAVALIALLTVQGFVLQTAVALTGDPAPRYGRALVTAWMAGIATLVGVGLWKVTFGLVIGFFAPTVASVLAVGLGVAITGLVIKGRIGLRAGHALMVAALHSLMAWGASAAVWWLYHSLFGA